MTYIITNADRNIMKTTTRDGRTGPEVMQSQASRTLLPVNTGLQKSALETSYGSFSSSQIAMTSPSFYSPLHTPTNWQIPTRRKDVYTWCVLPNTGITTLSEDKNHVIRQKIVDIKPDTMVLTHTGKFKKAHSVFKRLVDEDIYQIYVNGNSEPLYITGNHEIFASKRENIVCKYQIKRKDRQNKCVKIHENHHYCSTSPTCYEKKELNTNIERIRAENLQVKDYVFEPIFSKENIDPKLDSIQMARFLGYYLAEGHTYVIEKNTYSITFDFHKKELLSYGKELEEIIFNLWGKKTNFYAYEGDNRLRLSFSSKEACEFIQQYIPGKAVTKSLHKNILEMPKEWLYHFLGAYLNGDGSYSKKTEIHLITASKDLSIQLKMIFNKLGICTSGIYEQHSILNEKEFVGYIISTPIGQCVKLSEYCDIENVSGYTHLSKSQSFIKEEKRFNYITKIEKEHYSGYVYCLGVEDDESFVANGVAISNCRFFAQNNPTVAASLRFYSQFPFHGYDHVINDPIRKEYFDELRKRLKIDKYIQMLSSEYFTMGDAFAFVSFLCPTCGGIGWTPDGEVCPHEGGSIGGITILNPDWIEVMQSPFSLGDPIINLMPGPDIKQIITSKKPPEIYNRFPDSLKKAILNGQPIPLSNNCVTHFKHDEKPYQVYGNSLLAAIFPTLAYLDKLKQAQWIVADRHILPIKLVQIGDNDRPASNADIMDTQKQLAQTANDPNLILVTHHAFKFSWEGASGKILQLTKEYEQAEKDITIGLGVNETLLNGTGPAYSNAAIGIESTIKRLKSVQNMVAEWITEKIYKTEAFMKGFYKTNLAGQKVLDYPEIRWHDLNLRDENQRNQTFISLWDKGVVSTQFICEKLGIDYDVETERVRLEAGYQQQIGIAPKERGGSIGGDGIGGGYAGGGGGGGIGGGGGDTGNMPGGKDGLGLPGDEIAPNMSGGAASSTPAPASGAQAAYSTELKAYDNQLTSYQKAMEYAPSITKKHRLKRPKKPSAFVDDSIKNVPDPEEPPEMYVGDRTGLYRLSNLEQILVKNIQLAQRAGNLPLNFVIQQKPEPVRMAHVTVDGFFPDVKLIVEADGKQWHSSPEDIAKNQDRDNRLRACGWTVCRYTEDELISAQERVLAHIIKTYKELYNQKNTVAQNDNSFKKESILIENDNSELQSLIEEGFSESEAKNILEKLK